MTARYRVAVYHGEARSAFYIVDMMAPFWEQPAITRTERTRADAWHWGDYAATPKAVRP